MRIGGSLFLIAVGAVLAFAVTVGNTHAINVNTAGAVLMIVGEIGLLASGVDMAIRRRTDIVYRGRHRTGSTTVSSPNAAIDTY